jgi:hypothetical protein
MTVSELKERMSYDELLEWAGYEKATGPLDNSRLEERMATLETEIRLMNWMYAQVKFTDEGTRNFLDPKGNGPAFRPYDVDIPLPNDGLLNASPSSVLQPRRPPEDDNDS